MICGNCKKNVSEYSKFCSYCGKETITIDAWLDSIVKMVVNTVNDVEMETKMLKELGFNGKISAKMKLEMLIWRMFMVNLVIQQKLKN